MLLQLNEPQAYLIKRIWSKLLIAGDDDCWPWTGAKLRPPSLPYGQIKVNGSSRPVHKAIFEIFCRTVPPGFKVCHSCDNPPCGNPGHLWLGTTADNLNDMRAKGRGPWMENSPRWRENLIAPPLKVIRLTFEQEIEVVGDQRTGVELAEIYGVHRSTIDRARARHGAARKQGAPSHRTTEHGRLSI